LDQCAYDKDSDSIGLEHEEHDSNAHEILPAVSKVHFLTYIYLDSIDLMFNLLNVFSSGKLYAWLGLHLNVVRPGYQK
jgi:hypothetical protein